MTFLIRVLESKWMMWLCASIGDILVLLGIIFAALNMSVAGFSPIVWIILGIVFYVYFIISLLARLIARSSKKE